MSHITPNEVPGYIKKVAQETSILMEQYLTAYFEQETSRERVIENMNRHTKLAVRTLDEVLGFLGNDDQYF